MALSPTRPGNFPLTPPVETATARPPRSSRQTAPTVPPALPGSALADSRSWSRPASRRPRSAAKREGPGAASRTGGRGARSGGGAGARGAGEGDVAAVLQDGPGYAHRSGRVGHAGDGTRPEPFSRHHPGVQLDLAVSVANRSDTGVEVRIVLERGDCGHHRG